MDDSPENSDVMNAYVESLAPANEFETPRQERLAVIKRLIDEGIGVPYYNQTDLVSNRENPEPIGIMVGYEPDDPSKNPIYAFFSTTPLQGFMFNATPDQYKKFLSKILHQESGKHGGYIGDPLKETAGEVTKNKIMAEWEDPKRYRDNFKRIIIAERKRIQNESGSQEDAMSGIYNELFPEED